MEKITFIIMYELDNNINSKKVVFILIDLCSEWINNID